MMDCVRCRTARRTTCRAVVVLATGAVAALGPSVAWAADEEVMARVNDVPVTAREVRRLLSDAPERSRLQQELNVRAPDPKALNRLAVQKLIEHRLLLEEAGRRNLTVSEQEVDEALLKLRGRFDTLKALGAWLRTHDLDDRSLVETIRRELLIRRVLEALVAGVQVDTSQVRTYYEFHKSELKTAGAVRLQVIAVRDRAMGEEILAAVRRGDNFARMARSRSLGTRAAHGGDTGWIRRDSLPAALRDAIGNLKAGEVAGPLPSGTDFRIIRLAGQRPERTMSLEQARTEIERRLLSAQQQEVVRAWLAEQERKSNIEVYLPPT